MTARVTATPGRARRKDQDEDREPAVLGAPGAPRARMVLLHSTTTLALAASPGGLHCTAHYSGRGRRGYTHSRGTHSRGRTHGDRFALRDDVEDAARRSQAAAGTRWGCGTGCGTRSTEGAEAPAPRRPSSQPPKCHPPAPGSATGRAAPPCYAKRRPSARG